MASSVGEKFQTTELGPALAQPSEAVILSEAKDLCISAESQLLLTQTRDGRARLQPCQLKEKS